MTNDDLRLTDIDAIIFDCDGTLVDSEPITVQVLVDYVSEFGLKLDYDEAFQLFLGRDMPMIVEVLEAQIGKSLPDHFAQEYRRRQSIELRRSVKCIPGAKELLTAVQSSGKFRYCVASNAPQQKINLNLEVTGLKTFFEKTPVLSAYDIEKWKPDPALFLYAAKKLDVQPSRCVVIEDSIAGIQAGIAAGMQTIGYASSKDSQPTDEVAFVYELADLISVLMM